MDLADIKEATRALLKASGAKLGRIEQCASDYKWAGLTAEGEFVGGSLGSIVEPCDIPPQVIAAAEECSKHAERARKPRHVKSLAAFVEAVRAQKDMFDVSESPSGDDAEAV